MQIRDILPIVHGLGKKKANVRGLASDEHYHASMHIYMHGMQCNI